MISASQAPRSIGQVLDAGFSLYRRAFLVAIPYTIIAALIGFASQFYFRMNQPQLVLGQMPHFSLGLVAVYFLVILASMSLQQGMLCKLDDVYSDNNRLSLIDGLLLGAKRLLPVVGAFLICMICFCLVAIAAAIVVGIVGAVAGAAGGKIVAVIVGGLFGIAAVVGLFWSFVACGFFIFAAVLDGAGPLKSLGRSMALVQGNFWRTATIQTVALIIVIAAYAALAALAALIVPFGGMAKVLTGQAIAFSTAQLVVLLAMGVLNALCYPLMYSIGIANYRDLILRKSGDDLAARIADAA